MRVKLFAMAAACALSAGMTAAEARPFDTSGNVQLGEFNSEAAGERRSARTERTRGRRTARSARYTGERGYRSGRMYLGGLGPRPRRWCGWWMRTQRGGGPEFNLAWNWRKYGRPTTPQVGAVVVWRNHVGEIVGRAGNGQWLVRSGNDGGTVRTRVRSVAGAIFRI
jgi:hypothetical protein